MTQKKNLRIILLLATVGLGTWIIVYYWQTNDLAGIKYVPMYMMIVSLGYILLQVLKRSIYKSQNWWDWLYYIGLTGMLLPIFFVTEENASTFHLVTDYGSFFFVIPALLDSRLLIDKREEEE